jgi:hypothetical protein
MTDNLVDCALEWLMTLAELAFYLWLIFGLDFFKRFF